MVVIWSSVDHALEVSHQPGNLLGHVTDVLQYFMQDVGDYHQRTFARCLSLVANIRAFRAIETLQCQVACCSGAPT